MYSTSARPDMFGVVIPHRITERLKQTNVPLEHVLNFRLIEKHLSDEDLQILLVLNNPEVNPLVGQSTDKNFVKSLYQSWQAQLDKRCHSWLSDILNESPELSEDQSKRLYSLLEQLKLDYVRNEIMVQFFTHDQNGQPFPNVSTVEDTLISQEVVNQDCCEDEQIEVKALSDYSFAIIIKPNQLNLFNLRNLLTKQNCQCDGKTANMLGEIIKLFYVYQSPDRIAQYGWFRLYLQSL